MSAQARLKRVAMVRIRDAQDVIAAWEAQSLPVMRKSHFNREVARRAYLECVRRCDLDRYEAANVLRHLPAWLATRGRL